MLNPGVYSLGDFTVTTAGTQTGDPVTGFAGAVSINFQARLAYGSAGTSIDVYAQTSLDEGTTWRDIAQWSWTTASDNKAYNLSGNTDKTTAVAATDGTLSANTSVAGFLGDRFRVKIVSVGTYAGSTVVSVRATAR